MQHKTRMILIQIKFPDLQSQLIQFWNDLWNSLSQTNVAEGFHKNKPQTFYILFFAINSDSFLLLYKWCLFRMFCLVEWCKWEGCLSLGKKTMFAGLFLCYCSRTTKVYLKNPKVSERPGALCYMPECSFLTELLFPLEFCRILHLRFVSCSFYFHLSFSCNDIQIERDSHCHGFYSKTEVPGFYGL